MRETKDSRPQTSLVRCCCLLGITRQAYYQQQWRQQTNSFEEELVLQQVHQIRRLQPAIGGRKLLLLLQPFLLEHQIKMGRDALFDLLAAHKLLIRKKRRKMTTTQSNHWFRKYPNIIRGFTPTSSNQLWVSDITYYKTALGFRYISFITDAYSRKIVGHHVADSLEAIHTIKALEMAISMSYGPLSGLIHHSDRGIQYCSADYVKLLEANHIKISMTENGDPLKTIAERVNGILKEEFLNHYQPTDGQLMEILTRSVLIYNEVRPHMSCNMLTPEDVHRNNLPIHRTWKNYYRPKTTFVNSNQD
ncbi:MAG: IS3 family transposase [Chitinophagales bacterium]